MNQVAALPNYTILGKIAQGAMGHVFRARHDRLDRDVAIKFMDSALLSDPASLERFMREARILASINHPNIVHVFDLGVAPDGQPYIVMEFVDGIPLSDRIRTNPLGRSEALHIVEQLLGALSTLHAASIIHRDIKPSNIMLGAGNVPKLLDFGIARSNRLASMTNVGKTIGTPNYMSPEQAKGVTVDFASDLYSTGIVLYELLTGAPPFKGDNPLTVVSMHLNSPVPPLPTEIPAKLRAVVMKALEKVPARRFASADAMLEALRQAKLDGESGGKTWSGLGKTRSGEQTSVRRVREGQPRSKAVPIVLSICALAGAWFGLDQLALLPTITSEEVVAKSHANGKDNPLIRPDPKMRQGEKRTVLGKDGTERVVTSKGFLSLRPPFVDRVEIEKPTPTIRYEGTRNHQLCRLCGKQNRLGANFCRFCGPKSRGKLY